MANPEYKETLDKLDQVSVCLYRAGICFFALSLLMLSVILSGVLPALEGYYSLTLLVICVSSALSAANLHVYSKPIRTVITWSTWIGLILMISDAEQTRTWLSLGFIFITFSGIALKESFCFRVFGLKLVPLLLAMSTFALWFDQTIFAALLLSLAGLIMGYLSLAKWRMPLHFDIGNKANYDI